MVNNGVKNRLLRSVVDVPIAGSVDHDLASEGARCNI
jgi:hypothetical protein